ncbi:MAG: hypothetical protein U0105_05560 [Candidatus Obscuribacterales bacterium]
MLGIFKSHLLKGLLVACACITAALIGLQTEVAAAISKTVQELTLVIRKPNVGSKARTVEVTGLDGANITVVAEEGPAATDNDLKIDAVFLAHALVSDSPDQVNNVKVVFLQTGKNSRSVTVDKTQITEYEKGALSGKDLVDSLELKFEAARQERALEPGPELERRTQISKRIDKLRVQQVGVRPFENALSEIEALVKQKSPDIDQRVSILEGQLADQEAILRKRLKASTLVAKGSGAGGTGGTASTGTGQVKSAAAGYVPPEAAHLKAVFQRDSDNLIRSVQLKNPKVGAQLRDIKKTIDAAFATGREPEAFQTLHEFQILVQQTINVDMFAPGGGSQQGGGQGGGPMGGGQGGGPMGGGPMGGGFPGGGPPGGPPPGGGPP